MIGNGTLALLSIIGGFGFTGAIDDLVIFNKVLDPAEVTVIYENNAPTEEPTLDPAESEEPVSLVLVCLGDVGIVGRARYFCVGAGCFASADCDFAG